MRMRIPLRRPLVAITLGLALIGAVASTAVAAPPANVTGSWTILIGSEYSTLDITNQGGPGAPGASQCRVVLGTIGGIAPIRGHYCPATGRIHLLHNNVSTGATVRTFLGDVSEDVASGTMHMAGTYDVFASVFGDYGEAPFSATK